MLDWQRLLCLVLLQSVLEKKKSKGILKLGQNRSGGVVVSQKQGYRQCKRLL